MKLVAKWIALSWSVFCLLGVSIGLLKIFLTFYYGTDSAAVAGMTLAIIFILALWIIIWLAVAGPALIIFYVSGKSKA